MKKILVITLILSLVFSLSACGDRSSDVNSNEVENNNITENIDDTAKENDVVNINKEITVAIVENAPATDESLFKVVDVEGGVSIDEYTGTDEIVVIPEKINGKTVVSISEGSFTHNDLVRGIKLSESIEILCEGSLMGAQKLEVFISGSGLKTIEKYAISNCPSLKVVVLNDGLERVDSCGIGLNSSLKEIYVPSSVVEPGGILPSDDAKIICEAGSAAEELAKTNGYTYEIK